MPFDDIEPNETKYIVSWYWNEKPLTQQFDTFQDAQAYKWNLVYQGGFKFTDVGIHLKQINRFGDPTIV